MSKIGRKPIDISGLQVEIKGQEVHYKGKKGSNVVVIPDVLHAELKDSVIRLLPNKNRSLSVQEMRDLNRIWGLERALLANKLMGAKQEFELQLNINGLGYKATASGSNKLIFSLGYSHRIDFELPKGVTADIDQKTGQRITLKSTNNALLGQVGSRIRDLKKMEPYKGTGVKFSDEVIFRKAGKTKSAS